MPDLLDRLQAHLVDHPPARWAKREVEFFLGTDREIGRGSLSQEKRVGITPAQAGRLIAFGRALGIRVHVLVAQGAGSRAGYPDGEYVRAGAEIVARDELPFHDHPPDVVHALKEPSTYESAIPRPFCRIGAVHTGDFHADSGLARLLEPREVRHPHARGERGDGVVVFDGSNIGAAESYRIPVRGEMSRLAGRKAAEEVLDHLRRQGLSGRVVVVGGGYAGQAAVRTLLQPDPASPSARGAVTGVHLFDDADKPQRLEAVRAALTDAPAVEVRGLTGLNHPLLVESLRGAVGVILAVARPGKMAPKAVRVDTLLTETAPGCMVVDISIDERGAVLDPEIPSSASSEEIIPALVARLEGRGRRYWALPNMPRAYAHEASERHGAVMLPYLATLLFLSAREGGALGVATFMDTLQPDRRSPDPAGEEDGALLKALVQDLRNGMAFHWRGDRLVVSDSVADRTGTFAFLTRARIPFEFFLRPLSEGSDERERVEAREALRTFVPEVHACLERALDRGVPCTVISHPHEDGTRTSGAVRALGQPAEQVLKCMVLRAPAGRYVAALYTGRERLDLARLSALAGAELAWATADEVAHVTGYTVGGIAALGLFDVEEVARVYVSRAVLAQPRIFGSAGSSHVGMGFDPRVLRQLSIQVGDFTELSLDTGAMRQALKRIDHALDHENTEEIARQLDRLRALLADVAYPDAIAAD